MFLVQRDASEEHKKVRTLVRIVLGSIAKVLRTSSALPVSVKLRVFLPLQRITLVGRHKLLNIVDVHVVGLKGFVESFDELAERRGSLPLASARLLTAFGIGDAV